MPVVKSYVDSNDDPWQVRRFPSATIQKKNQKNKEHCNSFDKNPPSVVLFQFILCCAGANIMAKLRKEREDCPAGWHCI